MAAISLLCLAALYCHGTAAQPRRSANDTTEATLYFTIDGTVTAGTKELKLNYQITDNEPIIPPTPTTMQGMTQSYCQNNMTIYDGSNPSAILTLTDARGSNQTYQVAKLADSNCWMLNNLKSCIKV